MTCLVYKILYRIVPVNGFRAFMINKHFSTCRACSTELADDALVEERIVTPGKISRDMDLWPGVQGGILALERAQRRRQAVKVPLREFFFGRKWQLALTAALLLVLVLVAPILLKRGSDVDAEVAGIVNDEVAVESVRVEERPARTFYFRSADADRIIVWVKRS